MAEKLLKEGKAYVDDTPVEKMREERMDGIESACRGNSVERNLQARDVSAESRPESPEIKHLTPSRLTPHLSLAQMWGEMVKGSPEGCRCCLRLKIDMKAENKTLRDPVGYRCNVADPHHRTGTKFKARGAPRALPLSLPPRRRAAARPAAEAPRRPLTKNPPTTPPSYPPPYPPLLPARYPARCTPPTTSPAPSSTPSRG